MKDNHELDAWWKERLLKVQGGTVPDGKIFACSVDSGGAIYQNSIFHGTVGEQSALDPVSIIVMQLAQHVGTANLKTYSFRLCVSRTLILSVEAKGLIAYLEAACYDFEKVHFTRLNFNSELPVAQVPTSLRPVMAFRTGLRLTLRTAEMPNIATPRFQIPALREPFDLTAVSNQNAKVHRLYMAAAFALDQSRKARVDPGGYNIAALLVSKDGQILSYGLNITGSGYFLHAELVAIFQYFRRTGEVMLPQDCRIYTTLKPCKMCAAYIVGRSPQRPASFKVFHGHDDRGGPAKNTVLDTLNSSQSGVDSSRAVSVRIGKNGTKPLRSYDAAEYDPDIKRANLARPDVAGYLSTIQYDRDTGRGIVSRLRTEAPNEFPKITNSLVRKAQKYGTTNARKQNLTKPQNQNVKKALLHILEFLQVARVVDPATVLQLSDPFADFSDTDWDRLYALVDEASNRHGFDDFPELTDEELIALDAQVEEINRAKRPFDPGVPVASTSGAFGANGATPASTHESNTGPLGKRARFQ
jgi:tRNA(Arg) A34 adenosine deaminase TadA